MYTFKMIQYTYLIYNLFKIYIKQNVDLKYLK